ncbi:MAG TPA: hypothetical protein VLS89_04865 [Candidatus Nanopelagicales bacterium]|nr:hypothetical protein [Candidatus Nanopelagicales bacterium]
MGAPRKISAKMTFDDMEVQAFFTRAGMKADPDAADLVPLTDGWIPMIDAARAKDRVAREAQADTDAARVVANTRLDRACEQVGDELYLAVDKDRESARWKQFFPATVTRFVRQALAKQVARVFGWLESKDPVVEKHRTALDTWAKAADTAVKRTAGIATVRGEARVAKEQLAEDFTRERDGVHDALSARGRERGLPREWADQFFKKASRGEGGSDEGEGEGGGDEGGEPSGG